MTGFQKEMAMLGVAVCGMVISLAILLILVFLIDVIADVPGTFWVHLSVAGCIYSICGTMVFSVREFLAAAEREEGCGCAEWGEGLVADMEADLAAADDEIDGGDDNNEET